MGSQEVRLDGRINNTLLIIAASRGNFSIFGPPPSVLVIFAGRVPSRISDPREFTL